MFKSLISFVLLAMLAMAVNAFSSNSNGLCRDISRNRALIPRINQGAQIDVISGKKSGPSSVVVLSSSETDVDTDSEGGFFADLEINTIFALTYLAFFGIAYLQTTHEGPGASQVVLEKFLADPINPGVNELFASVFNLLGLVAIPLGCLLMPGASPKANQKVPAAPFIVGGMFAGYGSVGLYMSLRKQFTSVAQKDLDFFTKNVLENKIFNWFIVLVTLSVFYSTGLVTAFLSDGQGIIDGYKDLFAQTAICSVSSLDLLILTLSAASLIPEDLKRRGISNDDGKANLIAASTVLLPVVGSTIYCALRPELPEE